MAQVSVQIEGLAELTKRFKDWKPSLKKHLRIAMRKAGFFVVGESKPITPIDKGFLRNATSADVREDSLPYAVIFNTAPYASFVHEGTSKWPLSMSPKNPNTVRQFLRTVIERQNGKLLDPFWKEAAENLVKDMVR